MSAARRRRTKFATRFSTARPSRPKSRKAFQELTTAEQQRAQYYDAIPTVMVMEDMPKPRETHILLRGSYDQPGESVSPGVPAILPRMPEDLPRNRLGLARWIVDPSNPLTARVAVNRFWQMYFGTGLVKTVDDFGSQGEPPSHPELLDWLATEFVRTGWDVKALQQMIVTSATYRQASMPLRRCCSAIRRIGCWPRTAFPAAGGNGARSGARDGRPAGREAGRAVGEAVPARRALDGAHPERIGRLSCRTTAKSCTGEASTPSGSGRFRRRRCRTSTRQAARAA